MSMLSQLFDRNLRNKIPFLRIGSSADRRYQRTDCYIISSLSLMSRPIMFDGVVDSVSSKGMQFRPASSYILDRRGEMVGIDINYKTYFGTIVAVRQSGYGIALSEPISDEELDGILEEYGYANAQEAGISA